MRAAPFALTLALACAPASGGGGGSTGTSTTVGGSGEVTSSGETTTSTSSAGTGSSESSGSSSEAGETGTTGEPSLGRVMIYATSNTRVHAWRVEPDTGALVEHAVLDLGVELGPLVHDPAAARLYVGRWGDDAVGTLAIDPGSGALDELDSLGVDADIVYLSVDHGGGHVLLADFNGGAIAVHPIGGDGTLAAASDRLDVGGNPHSIVLAPAGDYAFAPNLPDDVVHQLVYDATAGTLSPNQPAQVGAPAGAGPRHMVFAADARFAWVINEDGDSITRWRYDAVLGHLSEPITVSTLPRGVSGTDNYCADLHLGPDGAFLYGSNRGHDTLAMFGVDAADGTLTWLGEVDTEAHPRSFVVEPGARFVYAAGRDSGKLASYAIAQGGTLAPVEVIDVQPAPGWVEAVALPR